MTRVSHAGSGSRAEAHRSLRGSSRSAKIALAGGGPARPGHDTQYREHLFRHIGSAPAAAQYDSAHPQARTALSTDAPDHERASWWRRAADPMGGAGQDP